MPANPITSSPEFQIIGTDHEPSDAAISALARLLLSVADADPPKTKRSARPRPPVSNSEPQAKGFTEDDQHHTKSRKQRTTEGR